MAIKNDKFIFFQIPKTASTWVRRTIGHIGIRTRMCNSVDAHKKHPFGLYRYHATPDDTKYSPEALFSFCFVRNPIDWYKSFFVFRYRRTKKMTKDFPPDRVWDRNINVFVNNVIDEYNDFITQLYQFYVGEDCKKVNFIGKQENATEDLIKALSLSGQEFDPNAIRSIPPCNTSASDPKYIYFSSGLNADTIIRIVNTERWVYDTFYNGKAIS